MGDAGRWVTQAVLRSCICVCVHPSPPAPLLQAFPPRAPSLPPSRSAARLVALAARHPSGGELTCKQEHVRLVEHHRLSWPTGALRNLAVEITACQATISPRSPLHLPCISPTSRGKSLRAEVAADSRTRGLGRRRRACRAAASLVSSAPFRSARRECSRSVPPRWRTSASSGLGVEMITGVACR